MSDEVGGQILLSSDVADYVRRSRRANPSFVRCSRLCPTKSEGKGRDGPALRDRRHGECGLILFGEMAEWSNAAVSKTVVPLSRDRGFESPSLRMAKSLPQLAAGFLFSRWPDQTCLSEDSRKTKRPYERSE